MSFFDTLLLLPSVMFNVLKEKAKCIFVFVLLELDASVGSLALARGSREFPRGRWMKSDEEQQINTSSRGSRFKHHLITPQEPLTQQSPMEKVLLLVWFGLVWFGLVWFGASPPVWMGFLPKPFCPHH